VSTDADDRRTIVCPCHDATLFDLKAMVRDGYTHPETLKRATAAFMGPCQGKYCAPLVQKFLAAHYGVEPAQLVRPTVRAPLSAVRLGLLADTDQVVAAPSDVDA
jgi:NAD(P)H-nitrite reductase large subunit